MAPVGAGDRRTGPSAFGAGATTARAPWRRPHPRPRPSCHRLCSHSYGTAGGWSCAQGAGAREGARQGARWARARATGKRRAHEAAHAGSPCRGPYTHCQGQPLSQGANRTWADQPEATAPRPQPSAAAAGAQAGGSGRRRRGSVRSQYAAVLSVLVLSLTSRRESGSAPGCSRWISPS